MPQKDIHDALVAMPADAAHSDKIKLILEAISADWGKSNSLGGWNIASVLKVFSGDESLPYAMQLPVKGTGLFSDMYEEAVKAARPDSLYNIVDAMNFPFRDDRAKAYTHLGADDGRQLREQLTEQVVKAIVESKETMGDDYSEHSRAQDLAMIAQKDITILNATSLKLVLENIKSNDVRDVLNAFKQQVGDANYDKVLSSQGNFEISAIALSKSDSEYTLACIPDEAKPWAVTATLLNDNSRTGNDLVRAYKMCANERTAGNCPIEDHHWESITTLV
ncbi:MAG: hypothetical protein AAFY76_20310, partial [Cyanobacteria bacterium J06649_11]